MKTPPGGRWFSLFPGIDGKTHNNVTFPLKKDVHLNSYTAVTLNVICILHMHVALNTAVIAMYGLL